MKRSNPANLAKTCLTTVLLTVWSLNVLLTCSCGSVGDEVTIRYTLQEFPEYVQTDGIEQVYESIPACEKSDDMSIDQYVEIVIPPIDVQKNVIVFESEYPVPLVIERVDRSILSEEGTLVGTTYFDKPILFGESGVADRINAYFENNCHDFFFGESRMNFYGSRVYDVFEDKVNKNLELLFSFAKQDSFYNTVETQLTHSSDELLSFVNKTYWTVGGVSTHYCYGVTFDMTSGESIELDRFIGVDINQFRESIESLITKRFYEWNGEYEDYIALKCEELNIALANMGFSDFEYYYDGDAIYLLLNSMVFTSGCYIIRWDISTGELSDREQMFFTQ